MARYSVHLPLKADDEIERFMRARFVRDSFSFGAFFFGPFWLIWHRHYVAGILLGLLLLGFIASLAALGFSASIQVGALILVLALVGLESGSLRRGALVGQGFEEVDLVVAETREALEHRFFATRLGSGSGDPAAQAAAPSRSTAAPLARPTVLGLFPHQGHHS